MTGNIKGIKSSISLSFGKEAEDEQSSVRTVTMLPSQSHGAEHHRWQGFILTSGNKKRKEAAILPVHS